MITQNNQNMGKKLPLKFIVILCISIVAFSFITFNAFENKKIEQPKNVILMIGDGMGLAQIYAAYTINKGNLNIFRFPVTGICKTNSADHYVTDSGAGATAYSTGKKTKNRMIGIDTLGRTLPTILEIAKKNRLSAGMVVTCPITHATPAAFVAHCIDRDSNELIALDFLKADIDVFIGGGKKYFVNRSDKRNLLEDLNKHGYTTVFNMNDIKKVTSGKLAGLVADNECPAISQGRGDMLPEATSKALEILNNNSKGFFLMVEGSQIDWGGHENNIRYVTDELIDFDKSVGIAFDFARNNKNTLVIVIADHETGGLSLTEGNFNKGTVEAKFSTVEHTGIPVMVFAYGPGAEKFTGFYENTEVFEKIMHAYNFTRTTN